jgi:hypothetical protein
MVQVVYNKAGEISYARTRHYLRLNENKKSVFEYHKQSIESLKANLEIPDVAVKDAIETNTQAVGQDGQGQKLSIHDHNTSKSNSIGKMEPPLGFEPRTFSLQG